MSKPGFYNDNANRRYPFREDTTANSNAHRLPNDVLLDFGATFMMYSDYDPLTTNVWLSSVEVVGTLVTLTFLNDSPAIGHIPLVFTVNATQEFNLAFADASGWESEPAAYEEGSTLAWHGYVVIGGDLTALTAFLGSSTLSKTANIIEPFLIQNMDNTYVRSVNVANQERLTTVNNNTIGRGYIINGSINSGVVQFQEGYNTKIGYDIKKNGLVVGALVGAGAGQPCAEIPLYTGESSPDGGSLLSGGPTCNEVIKAINGVGGPTVTIKGGHGIKVQKNASNPHQLDIIIDETLLTTCSSSQA